jgi:hypothetical protein
MRESEIPKYKLLFINNMEWCGMEPELLILISDPVNVRPVDDKVALRQATLLTTSVSPVSTMPPLLHIIIYSSSISGV